MMFIFKSVQWANILENQKCNEYSIMLFSFSLQNNQLAQILFIIFRKCWERFSIILKTREIRRLANKQTKQTNINNRI